MDPPLRLPISGIARRRIAPPLAAAIAVLMVAAISSAAGEASGAEAVTPGPSRDFSGIEAVIVEPLGARRAELVTIVRQDCGSCHGLSLKGGLGPPLLPESLKDKPSSYLKTVILYGKPNTPMPPWRRFLSEAETEWIVFKLQRGFPDGQ